MQRVILLLTHICIIHACEKYSFIKEQDVEFKDHVITTMTTPYVEICWDKCVWTMNCFSVNVRNTSFGTLECDLNNSSKKASPGSLVPTQGSQYQQMGATKECDTNGCTIIKEALGGGWYRINDAVYKMFHENKTWTDARAHCQSQRADLASIKTHYENLFIPGLLGGSMIARGSEKTQPTSGLPGLLQYLPLEDPDKDVVLKGTPSPRYEMVDGENALYLPGYKGYAEVPPVEMNPEGYTFMMWFKPANQSIVEEEDIYSDWSELKRFGVMLQRNSKTVKLKTMAKTSVWTVATSSDSIDMGGWNHLAVTWNKTGKIRMTVNGTQKKEKNFVPILSRTPPPYHLGVHGSETPSVRYNNAFHGHMRQLLVFNNSMTDQEIQAAMTQPTSGLPGLLQYLPLEDPDKDVVLKGTPSPRYEMVDGMKALYLPGFKGYAEVPPVEMNLKGYTFMMWVKPANQSSSDWRILYSDWSELQRFFFTLGGTARGVFLRLKKLVGGTQDAAYVYIDMDGWNHLAVTWNKTVGKIRMTVNGTQKLNKYYIPILPKIPSPYHLGVDGEHTPSVPANNTFHGHVSHLMVFKNSMTDQEIQAAMDYGKQGFWIGLNALNDTSTFQWSDGTSSSQTMIPAGQFEDDPISSWPRCAAVGRDGKWMIKHCNDYTSFYVCSKPFA